MKRIVFSGALLALWANLLAIAACDQPEQVYEPEHRQSLIILPDAPGGG